MLEEPFIQTLRKRSFGNDDRFAAVDDADLLHEV